MARYRLNEEAVDDPERIFEFGIDRFGLDAAIAYLEAMLLRFDELAEQPMRFPAVDHIRTGYRRSVYRSHSIYYRAHGELVDIMRIVGRENTDHAL